MGREREKREERDRERERERERERWMDGWMGRGRVYVYVSMCVHVVSYYNIHNTVQCHVSKNYMTSLPPVPPEPPESLLSPSPLQCLKSLQYQIGLHGLYYHRQCCSPHHHLVSYALHHHFYSLGD